MQIVVEHDITDGCMPAQDFRKIDLKKQNICRKKKEFNLCFTAENKLKALHRRELVKKEAVTNFLDNVRSCVNATLTKIFENLPIGSFVISNSSVFKHDPIFITKMEELLKNLKLFLQHFSKPRLFLLPMLTKIPSRINNFLKMIYNW